MDLTAGRIFVNIVVYADESGIHDRTHVQKGSRVPVLCGFVDTKDNWERLGNEWEDVLKKYSAPYFHFSEITRDGRAKRESPFHGWSDDKADDFLIDLGLVATVSAVPIGGNANGPFAVQIGLDSFEGMMEQFYKHFTASMSEHWPTESGPVNFIFDQTDDVEWGTLLNRVHHAAKRFDLRIGHITSGDKKDRQDIALQVADMIAFRTRQTSERYYPANGGDPIPQPPRILDYLLWRNQWPDGHSLSLAKQNMEEVRFIVESMRFDERMQKSKWKAAGEKNRVYYPHQHVDTLKLAGAEVAKKWFEKATPPPSKHSLQSQPP
jgi:hypothetical protein